MRAIVIDPRTREIYEADFAVTSSLMAELAKLIGAKALGTDVAPPHTVMFLDAVGYLSDVQAFWRDVDASPDANVAGVGVMFGLSPEGRLADLPPQITIESTRARILWVDDAISGVVERMQIVDFPGGKAPIISRAITWQRGEAHPAGAVAKRDAAVDLYVDPRAGTGEAPAASSAAPVAPVAAAPSTAPALAPVWSIHETPDNRYRVIEYEVTTAGLGAPLRMFTEPNIDAARGHIPKGLNMRPADDDVADDTLVETWA